MMWKTSRRVCFQRRPLKMNGRVATKRTLLDWLTGPLLVAASVLAGIFVLYLVGLWVDH
jgi:hypothetical protein